MRKLNLKQGDKIQVQLAETYKKASKVVLNTLNVVDQNQFLLLQPDLELQLYNEMPQFRCL